jgi:hypothetical protein
MIAVALILLSSANFTVLCGQSVASNCRSPKAATVTHRPNWDKRFGAVCFMRLCFAIVIPLHMAVAVQNVVPVSWGELVHLQSQGLMRLNIFGMWPASHGSTDLSGLIVQLTARHPAEFIRCSSCTISYSSEFRPPSASSPDNAARARQDTVTVGSVKHSHR